MSTQATAPRLIQKAFLPGQNPEGQTIVGLIVKRTYDFKHGYICARAAQDLPIHTADTPYGDPMNTTIQYEADFVPYKKATDVVLNGCAYPVFDVENDTFQCSLGVNDRHKQIQVCGARQATIYPDGKIQFSPPEPFEEIELRYENAYGGIDIYTDPEQVFPYPRNPLGKGFILQPTKKVSIELPTLEDPQHLLTEHNILVGKLENWEKQPPPAGFGWYGKACKPRCDLAGSLPGHKEFEDTLFELYTKDLSPEDKEQAESARLPTMNFAFFNGASDGLVFPYLNGDEVISTRNLTPSGECVFQLPDERPTLSLQLDNQHHQPEANLYTVMIRMQDSQVDLTWCGNVVIPSLEWLIARKKIQFDTD
jgi:hypothetical protein